MSIEAIEQAETNREAALLAAADALQAQHRVLLWQCESIPDAEIHVALGIPPGLWPVLKAQGDTPPLFMIGRRLFVLTKHLREWLIAKAKLGRPGSKRLRIAAHMAEIEQTDAAPGNRRVRRERKAELTE